MTQVTLPKLSQTGTNEWADVEDNDKALRDVVNGNIDNTNLAAGTALANLAAASVTDAKLASPNNSAYKTLLQASGMLNADAAAGTYIFSYGDSRTMISNGSNIFNLAIPPIIPFDDADYTVAGKTQKFRVRASVLTNATAPAITFTIGLYPITCAGGADQLTFTLGTVVTTSTVAIASPAASTVTQGTATADFTVPSDGHFAFGVVTSGTIANSAVALVAAYLQTRNV